MKEETRRILLNRVKVETGFSYKEILEMDEDTLRRNVYNKDKYPEYHVSDSKGVGR